jgi:hypothetical protein
LRSDVFSPFEPVRRDRAGFVRESADGGFWRDEGEGSS